MVLENNIRRVFAKIYILGGLLKYFLQVLRKSRGGGGLIQPPYPNEYLYSISIERPIYHFITYKMVTNIWKFQPCTSNGFFLRSEKPKSWNFLELPRSFTIRNFFFKRGEIVPKMLGWCCKVFQTIRKCREIGFNVKFVILGQELGIWQGGLNQPPLWFSGHFIPWPE